MGDPSVSVDEAIMQYQKYGKKLPPPNVDFSRVRHLKN